MEELKSEETINIRLDAIGSTLEQHKKENLCDFRDVKETNKRQQESIDEIRLILEGSEHLGIDGIRPMLKEISENWKGMSWFSKNSFKLLIGIGAIIAAIVGIIEFVKRW